MTYLNLSGVHKKTAGGRDYSKLQNLNYSSRSTSTPVIALTTFPSTNTLDLLNTKVIILPNLPSKKNLLPNIKSFLFMLTMSYSYPQRIFQPILNNNWNKKWCVLLPTRESWCQGWKERLWDYMRIAPSKTSWFSRKMKTQNSLYFWIKYFKISNSISLKTINSLFPPSKIRVNISFKQSFATLISSPIKI